ncbi:MAG: hypothetical protein KTR19_05535 [Hyphomicrobiales bacterium]|nr:hypothetical protein [Hyphomicrobiales bacterium]
MTESGPANTENVFYKPPRALQIVLSVAFFLLILFMVNAFAGSIWLAMRNLELDAIIFGLMFVLGGVLLFYTGIFLFAASHSRVNLDAEAANLVLPNWRGPTPLFPYSECTIPYSDVAAIETRSEIYRYFVLPVIVQSASVVRKDGRRVTLGYVQEDPLDPWIPFHTIAEQVAERASVPITHRGVVDGSSGLRALVQDEPPWDTPEISEEKVAAVRKRERLGWITVVFFLALIIFGAGAYQLARMTG